MVPAGLARTEMSGSGPAFHRFSQPAVSSTLEPRSMPAELRWPGSSSSRMPAQSSAIDKTTLPSASSGRPLHSGQNAVTISADAGGQIAQ